MKKVLVLNVTRNNLKEKLEKLQDFYKKYSHASRAKIDPMGEGILITVYGDSDDTEAHNTRKIFLEFVDASTNEERIAAQIEDYYKVCEDENLDASRIITVPVKDAVAMIAFATPASYHFTDDDDVEDSEDDDNATDRNENAAESGQESNSDGSGIKAADTQNDLDNDERWLI